MSMTSDMSGRFQRGFLLARALAAACALALSALASAQIAPPPVAPGHSEAGHGAGLPFFDARLNPEGVPLILAPVDRTPERALANIPGVMIDYDALLGTPRFVRSTQAFLTAPTKEAGAPAPIDIVRRFVATNRALFAIAPAEIDSARVIRDLLTRHSAVRHLTLRQQVRGVDIYESEIRASITAEGELINISSTMLHRPEGDFPALDLKFDDGAAVVIAAANVGITLDKVPQSRGERTGASMRRGWVTPPGLRADEAVSTKLVWFPLNRHTLHPAWEVVVPIPGDGHTYEILVDATDGAILRRHTRLVWDSTQPVTMRVFTSDGIAPGTPGTPTNSGAQFPVAARTLVTINPADVIAFSPNGWINDGVSETQGNNVHSHLDLTNANSGSPTAVAGNAFRTFDFAMDPSLAPDTFRDASVTQLFYLSNIYHDRLMALGFDEAAGNFQLTNFSGQGSAGDRVQADCQDSISNTATGSNRNNANFSTSGSDGSGARMQMYIFTGPEPDRDGSFETDIVFHELTHGTSIRLHGGLSGTQPGGMGEGWSDFVAMSLLAQPADDPNAVYPTGGYTTFQLGSATYTTNYYFGIRRFPYSTNLAKAPQTFADIAVAQQAFDGLVPRSPIIGNTATEVHNVGEVWCEMLNEGRAAMWGVYGFAGNQRMLQCVIDGMKLSPGQPTFLQARDSIIQANMTAFGGTDVLLLWTAFAKRGLGFGATSPASSTTVGIVESFATGTVTFTYPDGKPTQLLPAVPTTFRVGTSTFNLTVTPGTQSLFYSVSGGPYTPVAMAPNGPGEFLATIPAISTCLADVTFYVASSTSNGFRTDPPTAPAASYSAKVFSAAVTGADDGFETVTGWTVNAQGTDTATTGQWQRGTPQATAAQPSGAHTGSFCFSTNPTAGASVGSNDIDNGVTTLTSPEYDLTALPDWTVSYWRWYSNAAGQNPNTNTFRVEVSTNGGSSWTLAETVGPAGAQTDPGWNFASWTFSSLSLVPTATVRFRFIAEDLTAAIVEAAIDDFSVKVITCSVPGATGACCVTGTGACTIVPSPACAGVSGGTYLGDSSVCSPATCPAPPATGACCVTATGACTSVTAAACGGVSGAAYLGDNSVCNATICPVPPPTGACCAQVGTCTVQTQSVCSLSAGAYQGDGASCQPNPCTPVTFNVSISKTGSGSGTVASDPAGLDCGPTCAASFIIGTNLVLTATPSANSIFVGWSGGGCTGSGTCSGPVNSALSITARFRCKADFNDDGSVGVSDIFAFLTAWFAGDLAADFNGGGIGVSDIFGFLTQWFSGC